MPWCFYVTVTVPLSLPGEACGVCDFEEIGFGHDFGHQAQGEKKGCGEGRERRARTKQVR